VEIDFSLRCFGGEIGGFVVNAQHAVGLLTCRIKAGIRPGIIPKRWKKVECIGAKPMSIFGKLRRGLLLRSFAPLRMTVCLK
jgi:hypothetical protein